MQSGFSADGYIIDQNCFHDYPYRTIRSDCNGCGWIAAYNLLKADGYEITPEQVLDEMNAILPYKGNRGTPVSMMEKYLKAKGLNYIRVDGKKSILAAVLAARAGMLRYTEGRVPHYVTFLRVDAGHFRFLNIDSGCEDTIFTMEDFFASHVKMPIIKAMLTA